MLENTDMTSDNQTVAATESINDQLRQAHNVSAFEAYALIDQQMYSLAESDWQLTKDDLIKLAEDMPVLRGGRQLGMASRQFNGKALHFIDYVTV